MIHEANRIEWKVGDLVIHDCDAKKNKFIMIIKKILKDGRRESKYLDVSVSNKRYRNRIEVLHDPKRFLTIKNT